MLQSLRRKIICNLIWNKESCILFSFFNFRKIDNLGSGIDVVGK